MTATEIAQHYYRNPRGESERRLRKAQKLAQRSNVSWEDVELAQKLHEAQQALINAHAVNRADVEV